jgi:hypothetical protein
LGTGSVFVDGLGEGKEERYPDDQEMACGKNVPEKCTAETTPTPPKKRNAGYLTES